MKPFSIPCLGGGSLCSLQATLMVMKVVGMVLIKVIMMSMRRCEAIGLRVVHGGVPGTRLNIRALTSDKR